MDGQTYGPTLSIEKLRFYRISFFLLLIIMLYRIICLILMFFCEVLWTHSFLLSFFFMKHSSFIENMNRTCDKNLGALTIIQTFKIGFLIHKIDNIQKSKAQEIRRTNEHIKSYCTWNTTKYYFTSNNWFKLKNRILQMDILTFFINEYRDALLIALNLIFLRLSFQKWWW